MCYFKDEDQNPILKEEFTYTGGFTVNSGSDFERHIKFNQDILSDYEKKMETVESYRMNFTKNQGKLIKINLNEDVNRDAFVTRLNEKQNKFRFYFTKLYAENNYNYYRVADLHNGDHLYAQIYDNCIYLNLHKNCCGNNVFRLYTELQKFFCPAIELEIDGTKMAI